MTISLSLKVPVRAEQNHSNNFYFLPVFNLHWEGSNLGIDSIVLPAVPVDWIVLVYNI